MDCGGCENKIKKALQNLKGVEEVEVDMKLQKVRVMGWAEQEKILKTVRKAGRRADMWPYTPEDQHNFNVQQYYHQNHHSISVVFPVVSSNYFFHNYDQQAPTPSSTSTMVDDSTTSMFSDDNPHACSIM
ncbi:heavy metal-associated isoprenylated plant protein 28-like [Humulus lupulus]|uniref:heavy metal-associated isoprenylated plant protein 28-like n=1 Tax=Humulus lupulus TaxID=3486 RepID=UPI002B40C23D|nr:heavy metal-associated isoprenylated plant protein 28-like [Humulus lupulus]